MNKFITWINKRLKEERRVLKEIEENNKHFSPDVAMDIAAQVKAIQVLLEVRRQYKERE